MTKTLKTIWNVITTVVVVLVVILALLLVGARVIGLRVYTVLSGSMEPTYHVGSLIYVKEKDPFTIASGEVITFMLDEDTIATHRVVAVVPDEDDASTIRFRTKGDANEAEDGSLVHYKNVIGTPVFTIPGLGYVADYIQHPPGTYIAIAAGVIILLLVFLPDLFPEEEEKKSKTAKPQAAKTVPTPKRAKPEAAKPAPSETKRSPREEPVREAHDQRRTQRSGSTRKRTSDGASELSPSGGSETKRSPRGRYQGRH